MPKKASGSAPDSFKSSEGMEGLLLWAGKIRLEKIRSPWRWLLLLLPLLLLLLLVLPWNCSSPPASSSPPTEKFFGVNVATESFIIIVDRSGSMNPIFGDIRAEARRFLNERRKKGKCFGDLIVFDSSARSTLGDIEELTDYNAEKIHAELDKLQPAGGTNLEAAMDLAVNQIKKHGKKTTLLILTDGEDNSISGLISDRDNLIFRSQPGEMKVNIITPRFVLPNGNRDPRPISQNEQNLSQLSHSLNGQFGSGEVSQ